MKIKYDSREVDRSKQAVAPPRPGVYRAKVAEANFEKAAEGSHGDRIVFVARLEEADVNGDGKHYGFWDYVPVDLDWKIDNWLVACGVDTEANPTGTFDVPKDFVNKTVRIRVKSDTYNGEYRPKLGAVMPYLGDDEVGEDDDAGYDDDGTIEAQDEDAASGDGEEDILALGNDADDSDDDAQIRLTELAEENGLDPDDYSTWVLLAQALDKLINPPPAPAKKAAAKKVAASKKAAPAAASDEPEDDYDTLDVASLRAELEERELSTGGSKAALIARLRANDAEPF